MADFFKRIDEEDLGTPGQGKILISEPFLFDPNFKRTVVFLVEHNDEGTIGFILNRPVDMKLNDILEEFPKFEADVFMGGPVGNENLFFIHKLGAELGDAKEVIDGIYWGGDYEKLRLLADTGQLKQGDIRFFVGYAGWSPGQLMEEMQQRSWIVTNINAKQVMEDSDKGFWKKLLGEMGDNYEIMSNFPEDPQLN